jgi:hypothetical protein
MTDISDNPAAQIAALVMLGFIIAPFAMIAIIAIAESIADASLRRGRKGN